MNLFSDVCSHLPVSNLSIQYSHSQPYSHPTSPAPPANQSYIHQWTVGAVYYSAIVLAEAFGKTNTSQTIDLFANGNNPLTPAYAIYEQGQLSKVALINYMDDNQTGTNDLQVTVQLSSGLPQSVQVKYVVFFFWGWLDEFLIFF
jgi:Glycosyl hydrolase family 79 C-terminal beta domain